MKLQIAKQGSDEISKKNLHDMARKIMEAFCEFLDEKHTIVQVFSSKNRISLGTKVAKV